MCEPQEAREGRQGLAQMYRATYAMPCACNKAMNSAPLPVLRTSDADDCSHPGPDGPGYFLPVLADRRTRLTNDCRNRNGIHQLFKD